MSSKYKKDERDEFCEVILVNANTNDSIFMPTTPFNVFSYLIIKYLKLCKTNDPKCYKYNNPNEILKFEFGLIFEGNYQYVHNLEETLDRGSNKAVILENNESYKRLENDIQVEIDKKLFLSIYMNSGLFMSMNLNDCKIMMKFLSRFWLYNLERCKEKDFLFNAILLAKFLNVDYSDIKIYDDLIDENFENLFLKCKIEINDIINNDYNSNHLDYLPIPVDYLNNNDDDDDKQIADFILLIILTYNSFGDDKNKVFNVLKKF